MSDTTSLDLRRDLRLAAIPDVHGHAKGEHRPYHEERPIPYTARMLFLWFFHACQRGFPRFMMVSDHVNFLTFEDPAAINLVRRAFKLAEAGDLHGASETAGVEIGHAAVVSEGLRRGMRFSIGVEVDADPRNRPDAQNIIEAMRPDAMIRSIHFLTIDHPERGPNWPWPFDNPEFIAVFDQVGVAKTWELYMATVLEAIEKLPGDILGHFYAPAKFGHWPDDQTLEAYEDQLVEACAARGMAIEFNTRIFYRSNDEEQRIRYREANLRLMRKAKAKGVGIAMSSDAHSPKDQSNGFVEALMMLDEAEINELIFPVNARMARVALRVTREHLERKAAPAPPSVAISSAPLEELVEDDEETPTQVLNGKTSTEVSAEETSLLLGETREQEPSQQEPPSPSASVPTEETPVKSKTTRVKAASASKKLAPQKSAKKTAATAATKKTASKKASATKKPTAKKAGSSAKKSPVKKAASNSKKATSAKKKTSGKSRR